MAKVGYVENGLRKRRTHKRRRNPSVAAKVKNPARRSVSLSTAKSIIAKNGLKAVSLKAVANGRKRKHHKRRRNGVVTATRRNGFFGNTKGDAKQVLALGAGALGVKAVGRMLQGFVSPILSQIGVGQYAEIITDLGLTLFVVPFVGKKVGGSEGAKMARLGGLLTVTLDAVEMFAPNFLSLGNPFNNAPIVMTGAGAAVSPAAVAQIAADVQSGATSAAKVAGVMRALDSGGAQVNNTGGYINSGEPTLVM